MAKKANKIDGPNLCPVCNGEGITPRRKKRCRTCHGSGIVIPKIKKKK